MNCRLCNGEGKFVFKSVVLQKYNIEYFSCQSCGYFQTEKPYWLEEAYSNVINDEDIGIFRRNFFLSNFLMIWHFFKRSKKLRYLDYSGGYGILVRLMRDQGFDFKWTDKYCENIFAKNAIAITNSDKFDFVTSFEVIEHVEYPDQFLKDILHFGPENILLSTITFKSSAPSRDWFYLGFNHGQHIGFFNKTSLQKLADMNGLQLINFRNLHLFSKNRPSKILFLACYVLAFVGLPQVLYLLLRKKSLN